MSSGDVQATVASRLVHRRLAGDVPRVDGSPKDAFSTRACTGASKTAATVLLTTTAQNGGARRQRTKTMATSHGTDEADAPADRN